MPIQTTANAPIRLCGKYYEEFVIYFGLLSLLPPLIFSIKVSEQSTDLNYFWLQFMGQSIFLNSVHTAFSFHSLIFLPEFKEAFRRNNLVSQGLLWAKWFLIFLFIFIYFWLARGNDDFKIAGSVGRAIVWSEAFLKNQGPLTYLIVFYIAQHHSIRHVFGIATIYNEALRRSVAHDPEQVKKINVAAQRE